MKFIHLILLCLVTVYANKVKSRSRLRTKTSTTLKMKNRQHFLPDNYNGPIENSNSGLLTMLSNTNFNIGSGIYSNNVALPNKTTPMKTSKTFRSVSLLEDSTIASNGVKYSKLYKFISTSPNEKSKHPGYYGQSRLT